MYRLSNPAQVQRTARRQGVGMDQKEKDLECLNHYLRNNVVCIQGCMKQIENRLRDMRDAWEKYRVSIETENAIEDKNA